MKLKHSNVEDLNIRWVSVDEIVIRTAVREGTGVPLLLLNGIGGSLEMLLPFVDAMVGSHIIMLDVPGAGKSAAPLMPWRLRDYANVCRKVLNELHVPLVNVMGISWGGALAQQFARQFPTHCGKLILAATSPGHLMVPGNPLTLMKMANPRRYYDKSYMKRVAGSIYGGKLRTNSLSVGRFANLTNPPSKRGYYYQMLAGVGWSSLPWLRTLKMPTLVMHGTDDPLIPTINAHVLAGLIPDAKLLTFDCGHLFMLTRANRVARAVAGFVAPPRKERYEADSLRFSDS